MKCIQIPKNVAKLNLEIKYEHYVRTVPATILDHLRCKYVSSDIEININLWKLYILKHFHLIKAETIAATRIAFASNVDIVKLLCSQWGNLTNIYHVQPNQYELVVCMQKYTPRLIGKAFTFWASLIFL